MRSPDLLLFFVPTALAILSGCSGAEDSTTTDRDLTENAPPASNKRKKELPIGAAAGEACGGAAAMACAPGLECKLESSAPGAKGTCIAGVVTCLALPTCDIGHEPVSGPDACAKGDGAVCYERKLCGKTVWCTKLP